MIRLKSPRLELVSFEAGKSEAWRWFKRVRVDGLVLPYAVCNGCFKPVHYTPRDGTGGLRRHACPLTVAMSQAKDAANGNNNTSNNNSNNNYSRKAAASRANSSNAIKKQQQQANAHGGTYSPQASSHSTTNEDDSRSSRHRRFASHRHYLLSVNPFHSTIPLQFISLPVSYIYAPIPIILCRLIAQIHF